MESIDKYNERSLLKFITCGSVDDGKSTLIGHLLYDAKLIFTDQEKSLELDSKLGSRNGEIDYSLLLDGLMAEREQGITIDVAYRYFTTENRSFIVADTPGHEQYTRNMAVGASFADLAIILVDARKGIILQTKRHIRICALMGIKNFVLAVNKMDIVNYDERCFDDIKKEFLKLVSNYSVKSVQAIPVSATEGDNITINSKNMLWYREDPLLTYLENIDLDEQNKNNSFIMPVQRVSRPNQNFRGFQGQIESGGISTGDEIVVLPNKEKAVVKSIFALDKLVDNAILGQPITIQLDREIDVSRGCVFTRNSYIQNTNKFKANILWMDDMDLVAGNSYLMKLGTKITNVNIKSIDYKLDINTGEEIKTDRVLKNEIALCNVYSSENVVFEKFVNNKALGGFIIIDKITNMTSACGTIEDALYENENVVWQNLDITKNIRAAQKGQSPVTIWFTGLSGSGKSTLVNELEKKLIQVGKHTMILDGDNIRCGLNKNLGFNETDRGENIRRVAEVAKLMNDAGLIVLVSFITPYKKDRENARAIIGDNFIEVYLDIDIRECEKRDVKGLYKRARNGEIDNFTGISSPYEVPEDSDISIDTKRYSINESVDILMSKILECI